MKKKLFWAIALLFALAPIFFRPVLADETQADLQKKIDKLSEQIRQSRQKQLSLNTQLRYLDSQITLNRLQVQRTEIEIHLLKEQITELGGKINSLDNSLNKITAVFLTRTVFDYKLRRVNPLETFFFNLDVANFLTVAKYYRVLQDNDRKIMFSLEETRLNYDLQKKEKKQKQAKLVQLQVQLAHQQDILAKSKADKERLLRITRDAEHRDQALLAAAISQLNALKSFAEHRGGGLLPPQPSPDGWYYNQRDNRWGGQFIGASDMRIWEVGCLLTDVAMVFTKYGFHKTPADIAGNVAYFFSNTAYMLLPWPSPPGYRLVRHGADFNFIDQELSAGRSVIVHLNLGTADGHFVVLKQKLSGGDYLINDPWYSANMKLSEHYSRYQITSAGSYQPN